VRNAVFPGEVAVEHARIVRIQRDRNAGVEQDPHGMGLQRSHGAGSDIARNADFERDLLLAQPAHQIGIFGGTNAMADAFRSDIERFANRLGPIGFPGVGG
jgi:hypothetical protein